VCVFVDGENLRHTTRRLFDCRDYLPKNADWTRFSDRIVELASDSFGTRARTYWYVVQQFDARPWPLKPRERTAGKLDQWAKTHKKYLGSQELPVTGQGRTDNLLKLHETLDKNLENIRGRFDGFAAIQNSIAHKYRAIEFRRSGSIPYDLVTCKFGQEKTVDVNLAVDMVMLQNIYDVAVIVSGDQDYVPAAQAVKNLGKSVVNVAFLARNGILLPGGARRLNQVTDYSISLDWEETRELLGLSDKMRPEASERLDVES